MKSNLFRLSARSALLPVLAILVAGMLLATFASAFNGTIQNPHRYAWSENLGWIDFGSAEGNVHVTDSDLTGFAWSETAGWISLNCSNTDSCGDVDFAVTNNGRGNLGGFAWGENVGWIQFDPENGGVVIDTNGNFSGYAWGDQVGWIVFNCATTVSCGDVNYRVQTDWRPITVRGSGLVIVPTGTSLTSTGSCTSSGKVTVDLSGQDVHDIAVSESEYFHGAKWVRFEPNVQGVMQYELALSDISSTKTIYALFRSATKNLSPVHSVAIHLADGCGVPSDDNDEEELTGGLMKSTDAPAVYYIEETDSGLIRRPFFNEAIYFTYFNDFDDVIEVSPDEMAQIPMGKPMLPKAGDTLLLKFFYNSKVYTITEGPSPSHPILRHIPNEQTAVELFGSDWNKMILELPDWMMMHAEIGGVL